MYRFNEILIALDITRGDDGLVRYGFAAAEVLGAKEVVLMHASPNRDLKQEVLDGEEAKTVKEQIIQTIANMVETYQQPQYTFHVRIEVLSGNPLEVLLKASKEQKTDLIMVGRKGVGQGSGKVARDLARKALCSVFSVPVNAKSKLTRILLPIDYSDYSKMAMLSALALAKKRPGLELIPLNIYTLPQGYLQSGKTEEEFTAIMLSNSEKRYNNFIKEFNTEGIVVRPRFQLDQHNFLAKIIFNVALVEEAELILMGSKGRTTIAAAFLGSTTEKLLAQNISIPTLIMKKRERNLGFFEALLNI